MRTSMKVALIIATISVVAGLLLFCGGMFALNFDFDQLSTQQFEQVTHQVQGEFSGIYIQANVADVEFKLSPDGKCFAECMESDKVTYEVAVKDGTLCIEVNDQRAWYDYIGIFVTTRNQMTVYLPQTAYELLTVENDTGALYVPSTFSFENVQIKSDTGLIKWEAGVSGAMLIESDTGKVYVKNAQPTSLKVETSTGKVEMEHVSVGNALEISTSTGKVNMRDVQAGSVDILVDTGDVTLTNLLVSDRMSIKSDTGDVTLTDVLVSDRMGIESDTGDVVLNSCDAGQIRIETDTGDVQGTLRTPMTVFADSDTGHVRVPKGTTGGRCEITCSTGDIEIAFEN